MVPRHPGVCLVFFWRAGAPIYKKEKKVKVEQMVPIGDPRTVGAKTFVSAQADRYEPVLGSAVGIIIVAVTLHLWVLVLHRDAMLLGGGGGSAGADDAVVVDDGES